MFGVAQSRQVDDSETNSSTSASENPPAKIRKTGYSSRI